MSYLNLHLKVHLEPHLVTASLSRVDVYSVVTPRFISVIFGIESPNQSESWLDYGLEVHLPCFWITFIKWMSKSCSLLYLHLYNHCLQVYLSIHSIVVSRFTQCLRYIASECSLHCYLQVLLQFGLSAVFSQIDIMNIYPLTCTNSTCYIMIKWISLW